MIFTELVLQNFGTYAGRQVINLRPEKDNQSLSDYPFGRHEWGR
jgi:hypothetical protein